MQSVFWTDGHDSRCLSFPVVVSIIGSFLTWAVGSRSNISWREKNTRSAALINPKGKSVIVRCCFRLDSMTRKTVQVRDKKSERASDSLSRTLSLDSLFMSSRPLRLWSWKCVSNLFLIRCSKQTKHTHKKYLKKWKKLPRRPVEKKMRKMPFILNFFDCFFYIFFSLGLELRSRSLVAAWTCNAPNVLSSGEVFVT